MDDNLQDRVAGSLLALMPLYHRHIFKSTAGATGIQIAQYRVLGMLMKSGGSLSMSEIGRLLYISKPYMTALADTLVENGWAERKDNPEDRRIVRMVITPRGKKHLQQAFDIYRADVRQLLSGLNTSDLETLAAALDDLQGIFSKLES